MFALAALLVLTQTPEAQAAFNIPPTVPRVVADNPSFQMSLTSLEVMHRKGLISDAEFESALSDLSDIGKKAATAPTVVLGKFATTVYGFVEADVIRDSTRSYIDSAGNNNILQQNTEGGDNGQLLFGVRNSRLGFRLAAPTVWGIRPSAFIEADFLGNQTANPPLTSVGGIKESSFWNNPTFRVRHALLRLDNDIVTFWFGQTWELVGYQGTFHPNSVEIQGLLGQLYSRTPQIRALHALHFGGLATLEFAVAALRPPQQDSGLPDLQAGIKLSIDGWKAQQTAGAAGTALNPAALAVSGGYRWYELAEGSTSTSWKETQINGQVLAVDLMLPIIPGNIGSPVALTFTGELSYGQGDADLFTGLTGGAGIGTPPGYPGACPTPAGTCVAPPTYPQSFNPGIDPGLAGFNTTTHQIEVVDWRSFLIGAQLYLPPDYRLWLSGNYSNMYSDNIQDFGKASAVWTQGWFADVNLFFDVTSSARLGLEYAHTQQNYFGAAVPTATVPSAQAPNDRVQFSAFYIF